MFDHRSMCTHPRGSLLEHPAPVVLDHNQGTPPLLPPEKCQTTSQLLQSHVGAAARLSFGCSSSRTLRPLLIRVFLPLFLVPFPIAAGSAAVSPALRLPGRPNALSAVDSSRRFQPIKLGP